MFLRNCWYAAAWSHELKHDSPIARTVIGEPIVLARQSDGKPYALEDRCPHRFAPLSKGRQEGDLLRCMYHGLLFGADGRCEHVPGPQVGARIPAVRSIPVVERDSWLWVWMGDVSGADPELIPPAFGLDNPAWVMQSGQLDYEANYQLINDNLCDLSHVDFVHEGTLGFITGGGWSDELPRLKPQQRSLRFERWFVGKAMPNQPTLVDRWCTYDYHVPGIFVMENRSYPHGTAARNDFKAPVDPPVSYRIEQQAVTPIDERRTRYLFATGFEANMPPKAMEGIFEVIQNAFAEDRMIIEGQQRILDATSRDRRMAFLPSDKGPFAMRRLISSLIRHENEAAVQQDERITSPEMTNRG
ncbi:MAG TPA: aromatic ring-hydroxylating dioxygenase subunit alpha [Ensifer sp.]|nr:aromatic ring-hydroxylating dioxygenase subunit alpha [Ensifer sp.]